MRACAAEFRLYACGALGQVFIVAAMIALSSCVSTVEYAKTEDLFRSIGPARSNSAFSKAKLALITTENSTLAFRHLAEIKSMGTGVPLFTLEQEVDPQFVASAFTRLLQGKFAEVIKVESADEARAKGATVIMVLDLKIQIAQMSFKSNTVDVLARFTSARTGEVIDTVQAGGRSTIPYPAMTAYDPFTHTQASETAADASVLNDPSFLARLGLQAKPIRSDIYNAFYSSQANQLSILELIKFGADWEDTRRNSQGKHHFFNLPRNRL